MHEGYFRAPEPQGAAASGQVILRDGSTATLRPARASDRALLEAFLERIAPESYQRRFFGETPPKVAAARMLAPEPPDTKLVLFVLTGEPHQPRLIATGEYARETPDSERAEVAFLVADSVHGKGLGTLILERLALVAARHGISRFTALTMARNRAMLSMFQSSGFRVNRRLEYGEVELDFSIMPNESSVARMELRERAATVASLYPFFRPRRVAVFGLSTSPKSASRRALAYLQAGGFTGQAHLINPNLKGAYPSLGALPDKVELALLALPQDAVLAAVDACGAAGVRALIVLSAGFAESGTVGEALQNELARRVRGYGMRLVGPNSLGLLNAAEDVRLNASLAPELPPPGNVAVSSQSGALALAILEHAGAAGLGLRSVVSLGNKADVSSNDLLQYWEDDPGTHLIVLYLASFGNPRRFARLARRVGRQKPILVVKAGEPELTEAATDALFRQTGVIRAATFEELFEVANLLAHQPLPKGPRVGVLTNASGPAALAEDALAAQGLEPRLTDLSAFADAEAYRGALHTALENPDLDALLVIFSPVGLSRADEVGAVIGEVVSAARLRGLVKPVLGCFTGAHAPLFAGSERLPSYRFPESAARALARAYTYATWRDEPLGRLPVFEGLEPHPARQLCREVASAGGGELSETQRAEVLRAFGVPFEPNTKAGTELSLLVQPHPLFGPVMSLGLGGLYGELGDKTYRITPLTGRDAAEMVRSLRSYPLLTGYRGHPAADVLALETLLLRVSRLVEEVPELGTLNFSVRVLAPGAGAVVSAARLSVLPTEEGEDV